jgi:hypothetical protein
VIWETRQDGEGREGRWETVGDEFFSFFFKKTRTGKGYVKLLEMLSEHFTNKIPILPIFCQQMKK